MSKGSLLGELVNIVRNERILIKEKAVAELWKRNGLDNPTQRDGYRIEEIKTVATDGTEVTTYKLWKLADQSVVVIEPKVTSSIKTGLMPEEDEPSGNNQTDSTDSPI